MEKIFQDSKTGNGISYWLPPLTIKHNCYLGLEVRINKNGMLL